MTSLVVDTSALVAIVRREPGWEWLARQLAEAEERRMSAPSRVELGVVLGVRLPGDPDASIRVLRDARIEVVTFDDELAERAVQAWRRFGKGRHPAGLNFGDGFTYALAERDRLPILCTGEDFAATDLEVLRPSG